MREIRENNKCDTRLATAPNPFLFRRGLKNYTVSFDSKPNGHIRLMFTKLTSYWNSHPTNNNYVISNLSTTIRANVDDNVLEEVTIIKRSMAGQTDSYERSTTIVVSKIPV